MEDVAAYEDDQPQRDSGAGRYSGENSGTPQEVGLQPRETFINTQRGSVPGEGNAFG